MSSIVPPAIPQWPRERVQEHLRACGVSERVALLGVRGYYRDSMGVVGRNDFGIYDDAIFLLGADVFASFNANTDPARAGINAKIGKPMAVLAPGVWRYQLGKHKGQYLALVQDAPVIVRRGDTATERGWFGINIHKGSYNSTSSEGCQTIYPAQWEEFIMHVQRAMCRVQATSISYALIEAQG